MAQFGEGVEGINAAQTVRITDAETTDKFTVSIKNNKVLIIINQLIN